MRNVFVAVVAAMAFGLHAAAWGADYKEPVTGIEFVLVTGGCFQMWDASGHKGKEGASAGRICLDDYYIGKYEVTQGQWKAVMGRNPSVFKECGDNCPVEGVSWDDAEEFVDLLSKKTGKKYRLPYEAEWEYAARSRGRDEKWAGTDNEGGLRDYAWYRENSGKKTHPVGEKKPNGLGIHDMSGNVWEWMEDRYYENYSASPGQKVEWQDKWEYRVIRGGSWNDSPGGLRFVARNVSRAIETDLTLGFRLAIQVQKEN